MAAKRSAKEREEKRGGLTPFRSQYVNQVRRLCELGLTDIEIADFFEVDLATFCRWGADQEFSDALKAGMALADDRVEWSLYHRAVGYSYDTVKVFQQRREGARPVIVPHREHMPPDTKAAIFWLKNRRPDRWSDTPDRHAPLRSAGRSQGQQEQISPEVTKLYAEIIARLTK